MLYLRDCFNHFHKDGKKGLEGKLFYGCSTYDKIMWAFKTHPTSNYTVIVTAASGTHVWLSKRVLANSEFTFHGVVPVAPAAPGIVAARLSWSATSSATPSAVIGGVPYKHTVTDEGIDVVGGITLSAQSVNVATSAYGTLSPLRFINGYGNPARGGA